MDHDCEPWIDVRSFKSFIEIANMDGAFFQVGKAVFDDPAKSFRFGFCGRCIPFSRLIQTVVIIEVILLHLPLLFVKSLG